MVDIYCELCGNFFPENLDVCPTCSVDQKTADDRVLKRLNAMLSKTVANGATEEEAFSAALIAQRIMFEYGLNPSEVIELTSTKEEVPIVDQIVDEEVVLSTINTTPWKDMLIMAVSSANRCLPYYTSTWNYVKGSKRQTQSRQLMIIGTAYNRFATLQIFNYLVEQIEELSAEALTDIKRRMRMREIYIDGGLKPKEYTTSWRLGCATRISRRIEAETATLKSTGTEKTTALVIVDTFAKQNAAIAEYKAQKNLRLRQSNRRTTHSGSGYKEGYKQGGDVNLNPTKSLGSGE